MVESEVKLPAPCSDCGGVVVWWHIEGSQGASGINCTNCHRTFTQLGWAAIELGHREHQEGSND